MSCFLHIPSFNSFLSYFTFSNMSRSFPCVQTLLKYRKFCVDTVDADGNCFYRAVAKGYYKDVTMHHLLRRTTIEHMMEDSAEYEPLFESKKTLVAKLNANKRLGVWNSDLADLVPLAVANLLQCQIDVYSVDDTEEVMKYSFGKGEKIRLLLRNNHYDLLVKN